MRSIEAPLKRLGLHPGAAWALSWLAIFSGGLVFDPARGPADAVAVCALGALFGALTWVGALGFAGRRPPLWIVPGLLALGLARGGLLAAYGVEVADLASLGFEPLALGAAAVVIWRAGLLEAEPVIRLALTASLVGLASLEVADGLAPLAQPPLPKTMPYWLLVALAAAGAELAALRIRSAHRALRLERAEHGYRELEEEVERERHANALLRRREAWLFDFFEKAPDLLLVLDPITHEIVRCNRRFSESLGYARRRLIGHSILEFASEDTRAATRAVLDSQRRRVRNLKLNLVRRDGNDLVVLANLALKSEDSGSREVRAILHDVTRLERSSDHSPAAIHRVLAQEVGAGLFHVDATGRCDFVNSSFCELTGLTPNDARSVSWLRCVHTDDRQRVEQAWDCAVRDVTVLRVDHRIQLPSGRGARVVTECLPVSDSEVGGFAGSMTRISGIGEPDSLDAARDALSSPREQPPGGPSRRSP